MIKVYQAGILPLGHFDISDTDLASIQGGEILVFDVASSDADERRAPDVYSSTTRSYLRLSNANDTGPFFFANSDKNSGNYSTPGFENSSMLSTAAAFSQQYDSSSKISIFASDGFYSIGISVVDDGYVTEYTAPNTVLYCNDFGKLTTFPSVTKSAVGYFIEYRKSEIVNNNLSRPFYTAGSFRSEDSIIVYKLKGDGYSESEDSNVNLSNLNNVAINTSLLPNSDNSHTLGLSTLRWKDGYFGPSSIHVIGLGSETSTYNDWGLKLNSIGDFVFSNNNSIASIISKDGYLKPGGGIRFPDDTIITSITSLASEYLKLNALNGPITGTLTTSSLIVNGSIAQNTTSISTDTALGSSHYTVRVSASGGVRTITLPPAVTCAGRIYIIKKIDSSANAVLVVPSGADTIDGMASKNISTQYIALAIQSYGDGWDVI